MRSAWKTDTGLVRENNEDYLLADEANGIFLLADGMGGGPGGEVASELAVTTSHDVLLRELPGCRKEDVGRILANALAAAHSAIAKRSLHDPSLTGMGTTLEIVVVRDAEAVICHVGDSRIYLFRERSLRQLTTDDNYATWFARTENVPLEKVPRAYRHVLTQAVGVSDELIPQVFALDLKPGDLLLLCSDGLTESLRDEDINAVICSNRSDPAAVTDALVVVANVRGGPDNVSALVIEAIPAVAAGTLPMPKRA